MAQAESSITIPYWVGDPERADEFCPICLLPSLIQVPYYYTIPGESPSCFRKFWCHDCGWTRIDAA